MAAGGKGFLSHKSFHPLKFRNQEAVWQAEQKVEKEKARAEELRKELKYEREMEEMEAMQVAAGLKKKSKRINWMYEGMHSMGGQKAAEKEREDLLTGKKTIKEDAVGGTNVDALRLKQGNIGQLFHGKTVDPTLEAQARIRADPMLEIMRRKQEAVKRVLSNPIKVGELKARREARKGKDKKKDKKKKKKKKKDKKKDKKKKKKKDKHKSHSTSGSASSSGASSAGSAGSAAGRRSPRERQQRSPPRATATDETSRRSRRSRSPSAHSPGGRRGGRSSRSRTRSRRHSRSRTPPRRRGQSPNERKRKRSSSRSPRRSQDRHSRHSRHSRRRDSRSPKRPKRSHRSRSGSPGLRGSGQTGQSKATDTTGPPAASLGTNKDGRHYGLTARDGTLLAPATGRGGSGSGSGSGSSSSSSSSSGGRGKGKKKDKKKDKKKGKKKDKKKKKKKKKGKKYDDEMDKFNVLDSALESLRAEKNAGRKKREERLKRLEERRANRAADSAARLAEMEGAALEHEVDKYRRAVRDAADEAAENGDDTQRDAKFLTQMRHDTLLGDKSGSLRDRVKQKRHNLTLDED